MLKGSDTATDAITEYFDDIAVDDKRIYELCVHTGTFLPFDLLRECLKRYDNVQIWL